MPSRNLVVRPAETNGASLLTGMGSALQNPNTSTEGTAIFQATFRRHHLLVKSISFSRRKSQQAADKLPQVRRAGLPSPSSCAASFLTWTNQRPPTFTPGSIPIRHWRTTPWAVIPRRGATSAGVANCGTDSER